MHHTLLRWLHRCNIVEERVACEFNEGFADLVEAGANSAEIVVHLAQLAGKEKARTC